MPKKKTNENDLILPRGNLLNYTKYSYNEEILLIMETKKNQLGIFTIIKC